ncbi:TPA: hypothetical protein P0E36_004905 [Vibrio harveyi]|nr:hypothetical protein [Vibrio harveyi]
MAKTDWKSVKKQYVKEVGETGVDLKAFCVRNGLNYSTARKYLNNKLLEDNGIEIEQKRTEQAKSGKSEQNKADSVQFDEKSNRNDPHPDPSNSKREKPGNQSSGKKKKGQHGGKRAGAGAPEGNKNAYVHGLMTRAFGDLVKYSHMVDDEFKLEVHKLASLQALEAFGKYKEELETLKETIDKQIKQGKPPTEGQIDELNILDNRMNSCLSKVTYHTGRLESIQGQMANREYTKVATHKTRVQTTQISTDTKLKEKSIGLADAKTEQSKAQTALAKHELSAKEREGLGDMDDLGMMLDELMDTPEDEILERFKENGGQLHADD